MAIPKTKKPIKLSVMGLFKWESEEWTIQEVALIMGIVMVFILSVIIVLKVYAIPTLGAPMIINKIGTGIGKIIKSRAP